MRPHHKFIRQQHDQLERQHDLLGNKIIDQTP